MRQEAKDSWRQAGEDLTTAEANIEVERFYASAFFSQQAAEKALKVLYTHQLRSLPNSRRLVELAKSLEVPDDVAERAKKLNPVYLTARYPNAANGVPAGMFSRRIADAHLAAAKGIVEWVRKKLW